MPSENIKGIKVEMIIIGRHIVYRGERADDYETQSKPRRRKSPITDYNHQ
jgi:hypothetical protein